MSYELKNISALETTEQYRKYWLKMVKNNFSNIYSRLQNQYSKNHKNREMTIQYLVLRVVNNVK